MKVSQIKEITSRSNPRFKTWLSLTQSKGIRKEGLCLLSGSKLIQEQMNQDQSQIKEILLPPKANALNVFCEQIRLPASLFKELDVSGTLSPIAVIRTPQIPAWNKENPRGIELIVALSDPGNLGSLLRSAAAFGVQRVIMTEECASPFLPKSLRASSGCSLRMNFAHTTALSKINLEQAYALDLHGENIIEFKWPRDLLLVLGEEGQGLPPNLNVNRLSIPMTKGTESLNATVAASVALFSYSTQFAVKAYAKA